MTTFVCFYTLGTIYEQEAARLRQSLDRLNLPHDLHGVKDRGSWSANSSMTASFLCDMLELHEGNPIVYVDADAVVWEYPAIFDRLRPADWDIALHNRRGAEMLNGTMWLSNTRACREVITEYRTRCEAAVNERNEMRHLADAIKQRPHLRVYDLPASYCWIHDIMADDLEDGESAVIEHLQASREMTGSTLLPSRRKRLEELGE